MKEIDVNPYEIGIWRTHVKVHDERLEHVIKREGWEKIPRVPIFELPEGHKHKYVLIDGHYRHEAAVKTNSTLPCNLYARDELVDAVKDKLAPCRNLKESEKQKLFKKILFMYLVYEEISFDFLAV